MRIFNLPWKKLSY